MAAIYLDARWWLFDFATQRLNRAAQIDGCINLNTARF